VQLPWRGSLPPQPRTVSHPPAATYQLSRDKAAGQCSAIAITELRGAERWWGVEIRGEALLLQTALCLRVSLAGSNSQQSANNLRITMSPQPANLSESAPGTAAAPCPEAAAAADDDDGSAAASTSASMASMVACSAGVD